VNVIKSNVEHAHNRCQNQANEKQIWSTKEEHHFRTFPAKLSHLHKPLFNGSTTVLLLLLLLLF